MNPRIARLPWIGRLLQALGVNSVPAVGYYGEGWSIGTTLALYWLETVAVIILVAARIVLHRRRTRKAGHWDVPVEIRSTGGGRTTVQKRRTTFLVGFLSVMIPFTAAHGIFLAAIIFLVIPEQTGEPVALALGDVNAGAKAMALFLGLGFAFDMVGLGDRTFRWIERAAQRAQGRMVITHLTIVLGMAAMAAWEAPAALFAVFFGFKTLVDLGSLWPDRPLSPEAPRWLAWMDRLGKGRAAKTFSEHFRSAIEAELRKAEANERRLPDA